MMNNKFVAKYNQKIDIRFLFYTANKINESECIYDLNKVYNGKANAITENQIDIIKSKRAFELLKEKGISIEAINTILLEFNEQVSPTKVNAFFTYIGGLEKNDYFDYACKILMQIFKKSYFGIINKKMAILIFNTILYQNKTLPIIFRPYNIKCINKLVCSGLSFDSFKEIINNLFNRSIFYNTPHKIIQKENLINELLNYKDIFNKKYEVEHVDLVGSYASDTYNEYSDIDLIVTTKNKNNKTLLSQFLSKELGVTVDVVLSDEEFALKSIDFQIYKKRIF